MTPVVGYRVADWDTPFWVNPNRNLARYGFPGAIVQYWSLHPLTPWAEYLRGVDIRDLDQASEIVLRPWAAEMSLPDGTIELTFETAEDHGLTAEALVEDDWSACQLWAEYHRPDALLVPSAALPGTRNLILYGPRVRSRYGIEPLDPVADVPCDPVAGTAQLVEDLLHKIRWRGEAHAGLQAWRDGEPEPIPPLVTTPVL